jgi:gliding motility-associated-like protein
MCKQLIFSSKVLLFSILTLWPVLNVSGQGRHIVIQGAVKDYRVAYRSDIADVKWEVFTDAELKIHANDQQVELSQSSNDKGNEVQVKWLDRGDYYLLVTMTGTDGCLNKKAWPFMVKPPVAFTASAYCESENAMIQWKAVANGFEADSLSLELFDIGGTLISNMEKASLTGTMPWPYKTKLSEGVGKVYSTIDFTAHFEEIPGAENINVRLKKPDCTVKRLVATSDSVDVWHNETTAINVLANDYDTNGIIDSTSVQIISSPDNGSVYVNRDNGEVEYKPDICFFSTDSFSYYMMNKQQEQSNIAMVYVNVKINPDSDSDNDGVPDIDENIVGSNNLCDTDTDMDGTPNFIDPDDDGDGIATIDEPGDLDQNGIPDYLEVWQSAAVDDYAHTGIDIPVWISVLENDSTTMVAATLHIDVDTDHGYTYINNSNHNVNYSPDFDFMGKDSLYYVVCDHYGICDTAKVVISVEDFVLPPEVFTPNNDGYNEKFVIDNLEHYPDNHLVIFNRWGNKVYEKTNYENDWEGNSNVKYKIGDKPLPVGVYYYVLKYANNRIKQGGVYLER